MGLCHWQEQPKPNPNPPFPETFPSDMVILLTSANHSNISYKIYEHNEPLIGRGGPANVTYRGRMTHDAYFELYEKHGEDPASANATTADLGTLVWRLGRAPFLQGDSSLEMQWDGNLAMYSVWLDEQANKHIRPALGSISNECYEF